MKTVENGYVYVELTEQSKFNLDKWLKNNKIPNKVQKNNLHITLQCSSKSLENYKVESYNDIVLPKELKIFECQNGKKAMVLTVMGEKIKERREYGFECGAVCKRESFEMHITLSYNIENFKIDHIKLPQSAIFIENEKIKDSIEN
jgi:hypothetical protein